MLLVGKKILSSFNLVRKKIPQVHKITYCSNAFLNLLQIYSKFTGEHPCRSVISVKLLCNFSEIILRHGCSPLNLLHIFRTPFLKNTSGRLLLSFPSAIVICIYKRFRGLGIADVFVSSSVIVEGSVDQALRGKHYRDVE